jgi:hypothetical protein
MDSALLEIARLDADDGWLENVFGLAVRESKDDGVAPLVRLVNRAHELLPRYSVLVIFVDGQSFNILARRRIYIHVLHERRGGATTQARIGNYIQAGLVLSKFCSLSKSCSNHRQGASAYEACIHDREGQPRVNPDLVLLPDDDKAVLEQQAYAGRMKPLATDRSAPARRRGVWGSSPRRVGPVPSVLPWCLGSLRPRALSEARQASREV